MGVARSALPEEAEEATAAVGVVEGGLEVAGARAEETDQELSSRHSKPRSNTSIPDELPSPDCSLLRFSSTHNR